MKPRTRPKLREKLNDASNNLISDLITSITGQIRVFQGENTNPGAVYGISRCLRMLHEHFETGFTVEARLYINSLNILEKKIEENDLLTIREVYSLNKKILDKRERQLYVEHTDGGIKQLAIDLLRFYKELNNTQSDYGEVRKFIENNTFFIIKHKELNKNINERTIMRK